MGRLNSLCQSSSERGQTAEAPDSQASVIALAGGLYKENYSLYANVDWVHQSETKEALGTPEKYQGKVGYGVGGTYNLDSASKVGFKMSSKNFNFNSGASSKAIIRIFRLLCIIFAN